MDLPGYIPPPFDAEQYRAANPDLAFESDAAAEAHYEREGRAEGRIAARLATREGLLAFLGRDRSVLEIGPFCRPLMTGPHVDYLDVLDADGLRVRAAQHGLDTSGCPDVIRYVGDIDAVDQSYDVVVSSHAIEHQPDLLAHLQAVERILKPGGMFALIVPDKRFCFDHFLPETGIADVMQAHAEGRKVHTLASVIEHDALATHNDAARHWAGDHRDPVDPARQKRIRAAIDRYELSEGAYLDVHAWQFTPDSFRTIVSTLGDLGQIRLEPIAVYDTPRDRMEFCAILQLRRPARKVAAVKATMDILFLQTADPFRYQKLLDVTQPTVIEYCRRHACRYESFTGIWRGPWRWQATYNRIPMLEQLLARGFGGWAVYMDADAYINDLDFDLPAYLADRADAPAIFATSGVTGERWDVNAGVAMINCGHPEGRRLIETWAADFAKISDESLAESEHWRHGDNDQDLLQDILRRDAAIGDAVIVESMDFLNSRHATFIRQHLRAQTADFSDRIRTVAAEVNNIFLQDGVREPNDPEAILDERGRYTLLHPPRTVHRLVVAPDAERRTDLAERAIAAWQGAPRTVPKAYQAELVEALNHGDADEVAGQLAGLGRIAAAQGLLGGARQHQRAAHDLVFAFRRAQRTYDALLSLAEVAGALPIESPELGDWGENARITPDRLTVLAAEALGFRLEPPSQIGGYLGIAAGGSLVLHLRMIESAHMAWRARQVLRGSAGRLLEMGGGIGLTAFYAGRAGIADITLADGAFEQALQAFVLAGTAVAAIAPTQIAADRYDLLLIDDPFFDRPMEDVEASIDAAARARVPLILAASTEAPGDTGVRRPPLRNLFETQSAYRLLERQRHPLRSGYVEEIFGLE